MNILLRRTVNKKGSVLFCVLCIMTFVVLLSGIALTVATSANQNMIFEVSEQQAYYTAKSAVDSVATYLNVNGVSDKGDSSLSTKLALLDYSNCTATDADDPWEKDDTGAYKFWPDGTYVKGDWSATYDGIGKYKADVFPTAAKNIFKVVAESEYEGHHGYSAGLLRPGKTQNIFEDAIVGLGSESLTGSPQTAGGITVNQSKLDKSNGDIYIGGNVTNTGDINFAELQHAFTSEHFENNYASGLFIISGNGNLSIGDQFTIVSITNQANDEDVWKFYSYLVCRGNFKIKAWADKSPENHSFATKVMGEDKGILVGGNFTFESVQAGTFDAPVYIGGDLNIYGSEKVVFNGPVCVEGNATVKGGVKFNNGLYVKGTANVTEAGGAVGDVKGYDSALFEKYKDKLEEKLKIPQEKVDSYGEWQFSDQQKEKMGMNGNEAAVKNYAIIKKDVSGTKLPCLDVTQNGITNTAITGYEITINDSGILSDINLRETPNGGTTIYFDTNLPGAVTGKKYKNLYIRITKNITDKDDLNKCKFIVKGKGNVYLYLDGDNSWTSDENVMTTDDPSSKQPRLFLISNSHNDSTKINLGGTITSEQDRFKLYVYAPFIDIKTHGSFGFYGAMIGRGIDGSSGSGQAYEFIPPDTSQTDEANGGMPGGSISSGYSVYQRTKR